MLRLCLAQCTLPVRQHSYPHHCRHCCYGSSLLLSRDATCSALVHEASPSNTSRSLLPIVVVVVVAAARRDVKIPGARGRGLVVDICPHHRRCCCRCRRLTRCACLGHLLWRISSLTYVVVAAVTNSSCACARWLMDSSCACARGLRRQHSLPSLPK